MFFTNIFFGGGTLDSTLPFFAPEYAPRTAELLAVLALDLYGPYAYGRYGTMPHTLSPCSITITLQYSTRYTHEGAWGCTDSCSMFAVLALINGGAMVAASVPRTANTAPSQTLILTRRQSRLSSRGIQSCCWG